MTTSTTRRATLAFALTACVVLAATAPASMAAADPTAAPTPAIAPDAEIALGHRSTSDTSVRAFIQSDATKTVTIDAGRNEIVAVTDGDDSAERAMTSICKSGQLCWYGVGVPYSNNGFSPAGTYTGTWGGRGTVKANSYAGQVWYVRTLTPDLLLTSGAFGKNSVINIVGSGITGKKVTIR
jgi:hypothetical protein